jgi:hypothetical protein
VTCRGLNDSRLATVRVPGRDEDYLLVIFPFEEQTERELCRVVPVPTPPARVSCEHETRARVRADGDRPRGRQARRQVGLNFFASTPASNLRLPARSGAAEAKKGRLASQHPGPGPGWLGRA